ncbi:2-oxo-tetronate isomerase [Pollutimonas harenae]|uniref:Hydroxypyruvate isomerase family protein n=1 Tax=Pollutimonas harenae TaxID=657015 RepID=A0A853GZ48_9BURK|nr:2-oxo-tetronate isomerase [Pollutimonas harenae]NYT85382.1 hydroxypyruvate isomerase family protein [Pollutimonas harenae]TEA70481.1 hydroxypyruvate isomerase family protein [Pollutimonas harenae]
MPKFAANITMMFNEVPFPDRFEAAREAGFDAVEFLFPYEYSTSDLAARLADHQLKNALFNLPPGDWAAGERGIASLPGRDDEFRRSVDQAIAYAQALGTPSVHVMAGLIPDAAQKQQYHDIFLTRLEYAAAQCALHGITVLIEPINSRDMPHYFLSRQDQAHAIVDQVAAANLKVQMDFYHVQIMEGDIAMTFRKFQPNVGHIQIAGVPDRHEPDTGEVNYTYLFKLLDELDYKGWVGCEYRPAKGTLDGLGWLHTMTKA